MEICYSNICNLDLSAPAKGSQLVELGSQNSLDLSISLKTIRK